MELTNTEREMLWIAGWSDLYDAMERLKPGFLVDEDWNELTAEECQGLVQTTAYQQGKRARFRDTFFKGKPALQIYFV